MAKAFGGLEVRRFHYQVEEIHSAAGRDDDGGNLRRVAACAVIANPYADGCYHQDLSPLIEASGPLAAHLGSRARTLLDDEVQSYGKAGIAGTDGEQEHVNALLTSVFGDALRSTIGGASAWISSTTKVAAAGASIDVPLAYKDDVWVRSHYDAMDVRVPDGPLPGEIVVIAALANRGRLNARLGGVSLAEAQASGRALHV